VLDLALVLDLVVVCLHSSRRLSPDPK
jgi:hypothetical protein